MPIAVAPGVPSQGRAWELITPPDVNPTVLWHVLTISSDGEHVVYSALEQLPEVTTNGSLVVIDIASRGANGWSNAASPAPFPTSVGEEVFFLPSFFAPDPRNSIWKGELPAGEDGALSEEIGLFRRTLDGRYALLHVFEGGEYTLVGASEDLQHVVFTSSEHYLAADASREPNRRSVYELVGSTLRLVDVDADGSLISTCGSQSFADRNAISRDGRRIFFSSESCAGLRDIYMREDGATTTKISAPQCDLPGCDPAPFSRVDFVGATASGSSVFFVTPRILTEEDSDARADLYRYDIGSGDLTLVSAPDGGSEIVPTNEAVRVPTDGARVYFDGAELTGAEVLGPNGLYVADEDGARRVPAASPQELLQLSANGRYALFATAVPLVTGDTDANADIYRYDADDGSVIRISTGPAGGNGAFDAAIEVIDKGLFTLARQSYRAMSADGGRIFFTTAERLLPEDSNGVDDVYEWAGGRLGLVSSGAGTSGSTFVDTTPDGKTALFLTADTLLPRDRDGGDPDYYAARIGGGFAESIPAADCGATCLAAPRGRLERAMPRSARAATGIRLRPIGDAARRRIAATGWIALLAEVPRSGRLSARVRARIGGQWRTVATATTDVDRAGPVRLRMRLSREARQRLAADGRLRVHLLLRLSRLAATQKVDLELRHAR